MLYLEQALRGSNFTQVKSDSDDPPPLPVTPTPLKGRNELEGYQVMLSPVEPEKGVKIVIETIFIDSVVPFPKEITQVMPKSLFSNRVFISCVFPYFGCHGIAMVMPYRMKNSWSSSRATRTSCLRIPSRPRAPPSS